MTIEEGATHRAPLNEQRRNIENAVVWAAGVAIALVAAISTVAVWIAASRSIDLTDEGIYLNTYRAFRRPELGFTGAPAFGGPLFKLLGWSVPGIRRAKLIASVASALFLGHSIHRYLSTRLLGRGSSSRARLVLTCAFCALGSFSLYAFLPQTPGYNDFAIVFTMVAVALALRAVDASTPRAWFLTAFAGAAVMALFLVKFPSGVLVGVATALFVARRDWPGSRWKRLLTVGALYLVGAMGTLGVAQLLSGSVVHRFQAITAANRTAVASQDVGQAYGQQYLSAAADLAQALFPPLVPVLLAVLAALILRKRWPFLAAMVCSGGPFLALVIARRNGLLSGGAQTILTTQAAFPLAIVVLGLVLFVGRAATNAPERVSIAASAGRGDLFWVVALLLAAPICQGIGTGNSPFAIATSGGALWLGGATVMIAAFAPVRGPWILPTGAGAAVVCGIALLLGAPSLWLYPFRASPDLRFQTTPVVGVPRLAGLTTDASTAIFLRDTYSFMKDNGLTGRPGFSSFDGTGLAYALELTHPPAGLYTEELLPHVLERRLLDACERGFIGPSALPVVLAADDKVPAATAGALRRCGIDFPSSYLRKSFPVSTYLKEFGMTSLSIWYPNPVSDPQP